MEEAYLQECNILIFINGSLCSVQFPCLILGHILINLNILAVLFSSRALVHVILLGAESLELKAINTYKKSNYSSSL